MNELSKCERILLEQWDMEMGIPEGRERLEQFAKEIEDLSQTFTRARLAKTIRQISEEELHRKTPMKIARATARPITMEIKTGVLELYQSKKHLTNREIGDSFGIDGARVSEILRGIQ